MPFVLMVGLPCSGKSTRARELQTYIEHNSTHKCNIIADDSYISNKIDVYLESSAEKQLRGTLKSTAQRTLNKDDVVILDGLNYIKGYRYELYCVSKSCQTPQCVIHCEIGRDQAAEWNSKRPDAEKYTDEVFDALVMRFEPPASKNRWDSPLFAVLPHDPLPCQDIYDALYKSKPPPPNHSTLAQPMSSTNFIHELDKITQTTVGVVMDAQKTGVPGDSVTVPGASDKVTLHKHLTMAELQRVRRQFISFTKTHPTDDTSKIANMFVQFINTYIGTGSVVR